ncbi:LysM peptidoglycan-binding domain-containing protein [Paenibacillus sp. sgz500958]|uniref:LysM peptidoglycan-binding domain-containing protein n=1 Tax=Paenibacillus sp. sgz500958 TaxID=3242475 RepID=UPI0036D2C37A
MLKYSTYRSIYEEAPEVSSGHRSASGNGISFRKTNVNSTGVTQLFLQGNLIKLLMIIMLVISGFTVVGNVFAGSVSIGSREDKRIVVEPGDTLWSIALKNKPSDMRTAVYIEGIKTHSGLDTSDIQAGDILSLPIY